jgi:hypothetical protein
VLGERQCFPTFTDHRSPASDADKASDAVGVSVARLRRLGRDGSRTVVDDQQSGEHRVMCGMGDAWGDQGFGYLHPGYVKSKFYDESYGVTL